jgi:AraC-like DNA-binding protein
MPRDVNPLTLTDITPVTTMLLPAERVRVDAAGEGIYRTYHRDNLDDVIRDVRERRARAVLVSVARCAHLDEAPAVGRLVREFPRLPAVALLSNIEPRTPSAVLALGRSGVSALVDVRQPNGWRELRETLLADRGLGIEQMALRQLAIDLAGAPEDCWRFFELLFQHPPTIFTVRAMSRVLKVLPSTLMSRFFRAQLPAPKRYMALGRLTQAARLFENPGLSVAAVANHLDYSSPQSFGRHIRTLLGITAVQFRSRYDGEGMLQRFREELILPYVEVLRKFSPLGRSW